MIIKKIFRYYKSIHRLIMKTIVLLTCLLLTISAYKNTTSFWQKQLNLSIVSFQSYAGYQQIDWYYPKGQSQMYYSLFGAMNHDIMKNEQETAPLIIWLQGGPGSGSQFGAFTQVGPVKIQKGVPKLFHGSWNLLGHLLFIDSPLNAGFSHNGDRKSVNQVSSTTQATDHLLNFLTNFFKQFPSLKASPVYIAGQSYAGHYIPNLARKILTNSTFQRNVGINLQGIAIGNGWTDPINQVNFYDSYLWSVGVVERTFRDICTWYQTQSMINIFEGKYTNATSFFNFLTDNKTTPEVYMGNISMFNFRNYHGIDRSFVTFLNDHKSQLGANVDYLSGNQQIYNAFSRDVSVSYALDVVNILRSIKVLIYNGQNDVVCNTAGVLQYLNSLNWEGIGHWKNTKKIMWTRHGDVEGWAKVSGNLWFVQVNGAGHMVPSDKPDAAFSMLGHFLHNDHDWRQ